MAGSTAGSRCMRGWGWVVSLGVLGTRACVDTVCVLNT